MDKLNETLPFSSAAPIAILGVPFDNVNTQQTIDLIERMVASRRPHYIATANVDFLVQASKDVELRRILFDAHLVLCDGTPLVWASSLLGNPLPERVAGSDIVPLLMKVAAEKGYRPYFLGATPDSIEKAVANVRAQYPSIEFAGYYSPPFNKLMEMDHEEITRRIIEAKPDLLLVGFGCPKQEKWISMHYRALGVPVSIGVGGTIDFLAGKLTRAPAWMQKTGTEWIYRLAQEPRRLFKRYCDDVWHFGWGISAQMWRFRARSRRGPSPAQSTPMLKEESSRTIQISGRLDFEAVHLGKASWESTIMESNLTVLDLSGTEFIDSTGMGMLIRFQKRARMEGKQLAIVNPSEQVKRALEMMRLTDFFLLAKDIKQARELFNQREEKPVQLTQTQNMNGAALLWKGELTSANADEFWTTTMDHLSSRSLAQKQLAIDLSSLNFIDSTGLGVMIRARKFAAQQGLQLRFDGVQSNVRNVIRLARLEDYLLSIK